MVDMTAFPLWLIFVASILLNSGAIEIGRFLGTRRRVPIGDNTTMLVGTVLGLLALMIGFTFSVALSRYEARREAVLAEANAIGTTALRARLLPAPHAAESLKLLREYAQIRLDVTSTVPTALEWRAALDRSNAIQEELWQRVKAVAARDSAMVPTGVFILTLNEMIDDQQNRLTAFRAHVPGVVLEVLYVIAILSAGFTGYCGWMEGRGSLAASHLVGLVVAMVILLIQDLDRPDAGFIAVSQQPMIDTVASLAGFAD